MVCYILIISKKSCTCCYFPPIDSWTPSEVLPSTDVDETRSISSAQCPEFVLSCARWRRFLTFVLQTCRAHRLSTFKSVTDRQTWQPSGAVGGFPQGTAVRAQVERWWMGKYLKSQELIGLLGSPVDWSPPGLDSPITMDYSCFSLAGICFNWILILDAVKY